MTATEYERLEAFYRLRHPKVHKEIVDMHERGVLERLTLFCRVLVDEMNNWENGRETKAFVFDPPRKGGESLCQS